MRSGHCQASGAWPAMLMKVTFPHKPAVRLGLAKMDTSLAPGNTLSMEPAKVGMVNHAGRMADAFGTAPDPCSNQSFRSK